MASPPVQEAHVADLPGDTLQSAFADSLARLMQNPGCQGMYSIELSSRPNRSTMARYELLLRITNLSDFAWTSDPGSGGVNLSWWWDFEHQDANPRNYLFEDFQPHDSAVFRVPIENPTNIGDYSLHIDLVNEHNYWFRQRTEGHTVVDVSIDGEGLGPWTGFQALCSRLATLLPRWYPRVDRTSSNKTLLVENRELPHMEFLLRNTVQKMGDGWGHVVYCSAANHDQIREICRDISSDMDIRLLNVDIESSNDYNNLCLNRGFWEDLNCEHVLVYQSDSILMKPFEDRFLRYDYIGASWGPGSHLDNIHRALQIDDDVLHGNGGLSLRSTRILDGALEDAAFRGRYLDVRFSEGIDLIPEDLYFSLYACRHGVYPRGTRDFSIEPSIGHKERLENGDDPFGFHKLYDFADYESHLARSFRVRGYDSVVDKQNNILRFGEGDYEVARNERHDRSVFVSVVITLYNYQDYIGNCIQSVLDQTFRHIEIIVVNDHSRDESLHVAKEFLTRELPITIIDKKRNTGVVHCRNLGIDFARGDFVFTLDADNRLLEDCIEEHFAAMQGTDCIAAYGIVECFNAAGTLLGTISDKEFDFEELRKENYIDAMAMFNRRKLIEIGCYDTELLNHGPAYEDWELWLRIGSNGGEVRFIDRVLSHYMVKGDSLNAQNAVLFRERIVEYLRGKYGKSES